jgi:opacity protein-like surface antigen
MIRKLPIILITTFLSAIGATAGEVAFSSVTETVSTSVRVQDGEGPYAAIAAGVATGGSASGQGRLNRASISSGTNSIISSKFGYAWATPWPIRPALEAELGYMRDYLSIDGKTPLSGNREGSFNAEQDLLSVFGMINFVLALDLGIYGDAAGEWAPRIHPYIGAGVGGAYTKLDSAKSEVRDEERKKNVHLDGNSGIGLVYQFFGGVEIDLIEDMSLFGEYKRLIHSEIGDSITDYQRNAWMLGLKFAY